MKIVWTDKALQDVVRLHEFLSPVNPTAAANVVQNLVATAARLVRFPRHGEHLDLYDPREIRRVFAGQYEIRYELAQETIFILRLWHGRELR